MNYGTPYITNAVAYAPDYVRAEFIRKVYSLFFVSVLVTIGAGAFAAQPAMMPTMLSLMPLFFIGLLVCIIALAFVRRTSGVNVFLFYLFTALEGLILGPYLALAGRVAPGVPAQAAVLTAAVFGGLTLYVLQTKKDFSYLGGMLFMGLIALIVTGLFMLFFHSSALVMLYCLGGILIFSGYVLYDTSVIMTKLSPDQAVTGAINLYLDLINLFLLILRLLMELNRR